MSRVAHLQLLVKKSLLALHIAVLLFGFTAILGKLIELPEGPLVWWRMGLTTLSIVLIPGIVSQARAMPRKKLLRLGGIGCITAIHWVTFFGAIKYSNVSVALAALSTASFMTAFMEPLLLNKRIQWLQVGIGLLVIPGIILVGNGIEADMITGIILGLISAFLAVLFSVLNKREVEDTSPMLMTFVELGSGFLLLCVLAPFAFAFDPKMAWQPTWMDLFWLLILAVLCTTIAHALSIFALKKLDAFTCNLTINLEPIYGILLAAILFKENETLGSTFYIGVGIILSAVFLNVALQYLRKRRRAQDL